MNTKLKFIDLFCGIGGFHIALKKLNCECVFACDIDKNSREVYRNNFNIEPVGDIKKINIKDIPDFDILCAGFPCQSFSNGGNKKCFDDERGMLFNEIIKIAEIKNPRFMILENVKHILKISNGEVLKYILDKIKSIGYTCKIFQLSPHNYGIPQQRERVFFCCIKNDIYNSKDIQLIEEKLNLKISDIIKNKSKKYLIEDDIKNVLDAWDELIKKFNIGEKISPTILINDYFKNYTEEEFLQLPGWKKDYMDKNKKLIEKYIDIITPWYNKYKEILTKREIYGKLEWQTGILKKDDSIYNYFIQIRQSGIRVKKINIFQHLLLWDKYLYMVKIKVI